MKRTKGKINTFKGKFFTIVFLVFIMNFHIGSGSISSNQDSFDSDDKSRSPLGKSKKSILEEEVYTMQ